MSARFYAHPCHGTYDAAGTPRIRRTMGLDMLADPTISLVRPIRDDEGTPPAAALPPVEAVALNWRAAA